MCCRISLNLLSIKRFNNHKLYPAAEHLLAYHTSSVIAMASNDSKVPAAAADEVAEKLSAIKLKKIEDEVAASYILVDIGKSSFSSRQTECK